MGTLLLTLLLAQSIGPAPDPAPETSPVIRPPGLTMREIFWGDRRGHLRHRPVVFAGERPIEGIDLYRLVGRPDLMAEYEHREATAGAIGGVGLVVAVAGAAGFAVFEGKQRSCTNGGACHPDRALGAVSVVAVLCGGIAMVAAASASPDPLSDEQRRALVDDYNRGLARQRTLRPVAAVAPRQVALGVAGRF